MSGAVSAVPSGSNDPTWLRDGTSLEGHIQSWWSEQRRFEIPPSTYSFLVNLGFDRIKIQDVFVGSVVDFVSSSKGELDAWWSERRGSKFPPSPFEFLVARGRDSEKVQSFLVESVKDISSGRRSLAPGILAVIAKHCSDVLGDVSEEVGCDILLDVFDAVGGEDAVAHSMEHDIITLIGVLPERSLNNSDAGKDWMGSNAILWQHCLNWSFSTELVECMMLRFKGEKLYLPPATGNAGIGVDCLYMKAISHAVPALTELTIDCEHWREDGLMEFFRVILNNRSVRTLKFFVTENVDSNDRSTGRAELQAVMDSIHRLADDIHEKCGVQELAFTVGGEESPLNGVLQVLVDANPGLEELELDGVEAQASLIIARAVKTRELKRVKLIPTWAKPCNPSPIFEALEQDSSLLYFNYYGIPDEPVEKAKHLLKVLEQNTSLEEVSLWFCDIVRGMSPPHPLVQIEERIEFYLALNRCGRRKVRGPHTSLRDVVNLLDSARLDRRAVDQLDFLSVQYGLLLESPSKWCHPTTTPPMQARPDRKRKLYHV